MCPEPTKRQLMAREVVVAMKLGEAEERSKSLSIGQRVRSMSTRSSLAPKVGNRLSDPYAVDEMFQSTTPNDDIPPVPPIPAHLRSSQASSFQQSSGFPRILDSDTSALALQRNVNECPTSDSDEVDLLGDHDGRSCPDNDTVTQARIEADGLAGIVTGTERVTRGRKVSDATATQSIRTTQAIRNVQTSRTTETAPPIRKGLIDIVSDEPRPEIVSVVHMHGYQPFAVGDPNLQHTNPFAFIHESTMRDAMYLTPGVPAETDISIKRLVDKCRVLMDETDKLEDI
jgi:hypothetical protein